MIFRCVRVFRQPLSVSQVRVLFLRHRSVWWMHRTPPPFFCSAPNAGRILTTALSHAERNFSLWSGADFSRCQLGPTIHKKSWAREREKRLVCIKRCCLRHVAAPPWIQRGKHQFRIDLARLHKNARCFLPLLQLRRRQRDVIVVASWLVSSFIQTDSCSWLRRNTQCLCQRCVL